MRVNVASLTGTHLLDLARELDRAAVLETYYTGLPWFRMRGRGLPRARVRSCSWVLLPQIVGRLAGLPRLESRALWATSESFDHWLARVEGPCDVLHVAAGCGLRAIRRARQNGALTICDRGSAHIAVQDALLRDEAARCGVVCERPDPRVIAKEEAEYEEADLIVVPSTFARLSYLQEGVAPDKVVTIPYGVRLEQFSSTGKRDDVFRVLCVAAVSLRKGIRYLLEAMSHLNLPNSELVLRGSVLPESRQILAQYAGRFRLHPPMSRYTHELRDLYSQASVLVLPSIEDGFGMVMTEAMACGVPVIATTNTGAADLITEGTNGFIVPIRDATAIRERLEYLYRHPDERAAMGRAALDTARSLNGWGRYVDQVLCTYRTRLSPADRKRP